MIIKRTHESAERLGRGLSVCVSAPKLPRNWTIEMNSLFTTLRTKQNRKNYSTKNRNFYSLRSEGKSGLCVMMTSREVTIVTSKPMRGSFWNFHFYEFPFYHFFLFRRRVVRGNLHRKELFKSINVHLTSDEVFGALHHDEAAAFARCQTFWDPLMSMLRSLLRS